MLLCHPVTRKVEESVILDWKSIDFIECVVYTKRKKNNSTISGRERIQLLYCLCITMGGSSPSSCLLTTQAVR